MAFGKSVKDYGLVWVAEAEERRGLAVLLKGEESYLFRVADYYIENWKDKENEYISEVFVLFSHLSYFFIISYSYIRVYMYMYEYIPKGLDNFFK